MGTDYTLHTQPLIDILSTFADPQLTSPHFITLVQLNPSMGQIHSRLPVVDIFCVNLTFHLSPVRWNLRLTLTFLIPVSIPNQCWFFPGKHDQSKVEVNVEISILQCPFMRVCLFVSSFIFWNHPSFPDYTRWSAIGKHSIRLGTVYLEQVIHSAIV